MKRHQSLPGNRIPKLRALFYRKQWVWIPLLLERPSIHLSPLLRVTLRQWAKGKSHCLLKDTEHWNIHWNKEICFRGSTVHIISWEVELQLSWDIFDKGRILPLDLISWWQAKTTNCRLEDWWLKVSQGNLNIHPFNFRSHDASCFFSIVFLIWWGFAGFGLGVGGCWLVGLV